MPTTISVIVPIYNSEKYLDKCLNSLVTQKIPFYEIICVDDCSTDKSVEIIQKYLQKYDNVKLLHTDVNSGPAITRNKGIQHATGQYLYFVDSDDMLKPSFFTVYDWLQHNTDIILFKAIFLSTSCICNYKDKFEAYNNEIIKIDDYYMNFPKQYTDTVFSIIIKKDILTNNNIAFDKNFYFYEDVLFIMQCLAFSQTIFASNQQLYVHYFHSNSITHKKSFCVQEINDLQQLFAVTKDFVNTNIKIPQNSQYLSKMLKILYSYLFHRLQHRHFNRTQQKNIKQTILNDYKVYIEGDIDEYV